VQDQTAPEAHHDLMLDDDNQFCPEEGDDEQGGEAEIIEDVH